MSQTRERLGERDHVYGWSARTLESRLTEDEYADFLTWTAGRAATLIPGVGVVYYGSDVERWLRQQPVLD